MKKPAALIAVVIVLAAGGWSARTLRTQQPEKEVSVQTIEVARGPLVVTLPVNGFLESAKEIPVQSEIEGYLVDVCQNNTFVKPGDFIYQLDTKELTDQRDDLARALFDAEEALHSTEADSETRITQSQSDVDTAQETLELTRQKAEAEREKIAAEIKYAEGETARAESELSRTRRLAGLNYIAGTKLRDAEKSFRQKQFSLEQQREKQEDIKKRTDEQVQSAQAALDLARHGLATTKASTRENLAGNHIWVADSQRKLDEVEKKIAQCTVVTSVGGMAVLEINSANWPERRPYRLGDKVQAGSAPVKIYDFKQMQVRSQIGEMDISRVRRGQDVSISSPTQPMKQYQGKVTLVEELAQEANVWQGGTPGKKIFSVLVSLAGADPENLRPGMTVDIEIVLKRIEDTLNVPIRVVFTDRGRSYVSRVRKAGVERVPVKVIARNDVRVAVDGNLNAGDLVVLQPPATEPKPSEEAKP